MAQIKSETASEQKRFKLLIIRFSSVGDVIQTLGVISPFLKVYPETEIHWVVRSDLQDLVLSHPFIQKVWSLNKKEGFRGLQKLTQELSAQNYDFIYDAHNNLRSHYLCMNLKTPKFIRRSKNRWRRFLLFNLGKNTFGKQFIQEQSFVEPLNAWGIQYQTPTSSALYVPEAAQNKVKSYLPSEPFIALTPSSAWELKRWPIEYFKKLIELLPQTPFVILGGPEDTFCKDLIPKGHEKRVLNYAGKLSLIESCAVVQKAQLVIGNDTGISHAADQMGRPLLQIIGPVLFGYPAKKTSKVLEIDLDCRPCTKDGRGRCKNTTYKKCLYDIKPEYVASLARRYL